MNGATVIRWGAGIPGREAKGLEVFGKAIEHFEGLSKKGRIHGHREYIALTGTSGGFMIVEGDTKELLGMLGEPERVKMQIAARTQLEVGELRDRASQFARTRRRTHRDLRENALGAAVAEE
mgnify:CR=1 FL=1